MHSRTLEQLVHLLAYLQGMNASEVNQILGGLPGRGMGGIAEE